MGENNINVIIVMYDGTQVIIKNCSGYEWKQDKRIISVYKNKHNNIFNANLVQYIGCLEDFANE